MGIGGLNPSLSAKENAPEKVRFSLRVSEGSRAEAALSPAGRCAQSAGESAAAISPSAKESEGSRTASVRSVRSVFINHGLFGLNGYVNENENENPSDSCDLCLLTTDYSD